MVGSGREQDTERGGESQRIGGGWEGWDREFGFEGLGSRNRTVGQQPTAGRVLLPPQA